MVEVNYQEDNNRGEIKLPKNIRQMGMPGDKIKIYIEDYVQTYLRRISEQKILNQRAAVLLGVVRRKQDTTYIFVEGAIAIRHKEIRDDVLTMNDEEWETLYKEIGQYFPKQKIIGWFLSRPGQSAKINTAVETVQTTQFADKGNVFYAMDTVDQEEIFYIYENGKLVRQSGYYIYYDRNEAMQNYMIEKEDEEANAEVEDGFRKRLAEREKRRAMSLGGNDSRKWLTSAAAVLLLLLIGITVKNRWMGTSHLLQQVMGPTQTETTEKESVVPQTNVDIVNQIVGQVTENSQEEAETQSVAETESIQPESVTETEAMAENPSKYIVKKGDTLLGIARERYDNEAYVETICELNELENPDCIYAGMTLLLP